MGTRYVWNGKRLYTEEWFVKRGEVRTPGRIGRFGPSIEVMLEDARAIRGDVADLAGRLDGRLMSEIDPPYAKQLNELNAQLASERTAR